MNAPIVTAPETPAQAGPATPLLIRQVQVIALADRMHQILTRDPRARLADLTPAQRRPLEDAAAVAFALVTDPPTVTDACYAAAHRVSDLGALTPTARRGMVAHVRQVVTRFLQAAAGQDPITVRALRPLVVVDAHAEGAGDAA